MITKTEIQRIRSLADKRGRSEEGLFIAEGEKLVRELQASHLCIRTIYALPGLFRGDEVTEVSPKEMERISLLKTPSNSLATIEIPHYELNPDELVGQLVLALDDVQNPGNLGTIIRLADWFGITDIVCSEDAADCFNPKVVQATMGAILRVKVHYTNLENFLSKAQRADVPIYGTFLEGENIYESALSASGIIVMGNEGRGVRPSTTNQINHKLFIPPYPTDRSGSESLNVAMATGIVCSEFRRQSSAKTGQ